MNELETLVKNNNGTVSDLHEFLKAFARKHFLIDDASGRAKIHPRWLEEVKVAQKDFDELVGLSDKEKQNRTDAYNDSLELSFVEHENKSVVNEECIGRMLDLVSDWVPHEYELIEIKHGAQEFLRDMVPVSPGEVISKKTVAEWFAERLEIASRLLQNKIKLYHYELTRVENINKTLDELTRSFEQPA